MARPRIRYRTLAALVLLGVLVCVFVSLGNWQLRRAGERVALAQAIEAGRARAPLPLSASTPQAQLQAWRPATARGVWRDALSVVMVGGVDRPELGLPSLDLAGIGRMFARITESHAERMEKLGLDA